MAAAPQAKSDTAARARRDRRRQRMMPGNGADRSLGRGWVTQYPSASKRPPRAKVQPYPPDANVTVLFPPHDGARPRAADLLGESEKRFRTLVEVSPQIVWFGSADGRITYCNPYWHAYTGLTPDDTSGDGWASVVHPDHRERVLDAWKKAVESVGEYEVEIPFRRASDRSYRWFLTKGLPVRDGAGRVERWIGIALDIHERKQAEEARELLSRELSHRIKNIFAVVSGLAILSARGRPDAQPFAGAFRERVQALAQAHEYVRPYSPDLPRSGEQTVQGLLRALLAPYLEDRQARFRVEGDDVPVGASAATALALIVHEQATNAVKYGALSQEGGHVHVSTEQAS